MEIERRTYTATIEKGEERNVKGYASVFGKQSQDLGGFREIIAPTAFEGRLDDDVRALFNHDSNLILGRTTSKTLRLFVDSEGLGYDVDFPNTSYANDLLESVKRGDITQSSFAFTVREDEWLYEDGEIVRVVHRADKLYDVSPVTYPAYTDATAAMRSLDKFKNIKRDLQKRLNDLERIKTPKWA
jgi:HK97 family phage prohead protease